MNRISKCTAAFLVVFAFLFLSFGRQAYAVEDGVAADIAATANFRFSHDGDTQALFDNNVDTYILMPEGETLEVLFDNLAGWFYFEWYVLPMGGYNLTQYAADGQLILEDDFTKDSGYLNHGIRVSEGTRRITVTAKGDGGALSAVCLYSEGEKPAQLQIWKPRHSKLDVLLFSAHPDDEQLFFGTILPLYAGEYERAAGIVYLSHQKRLRQSEALAGLWTCGLENYPVFAGFQDFYCSTAAEAAAALGEEATLKFVVEQLRKYKPEVVVTHAANGEYGHGMHKLLAATLGTAVEVAADPSVFPETAAAYGTWQVKKLYLHGTGNEQVKLPGYDGTALTQNTAQAGNGEPVTLPYDKPLSAFDGQTAFEMAKQGYACHVSQQAYWFYVSVDNEYSCAVFNAVFSTVGSDVDCQDLLENIPLNSMSETVPDTQSEADLTSVKERVTVSVTAHRFLSAKKVGGIRGKMWHHRLFLVPG